MTPLKKMVGNTFFYTSLFGIITFVFFGFFYNYHLFFEEQFQFFILTPTYFLQYLRLPGGLSGYIGGFLTQFYILPFAGPIIISLLLVSVQLLTARIVKKVNSNSGLYPLSFLPALYYWFLLCDNLFPLSGLVGFAVTLGFVIIYLSIKKELFRMTFGFFSIFILYFLSGLGNILFLISTIIIEIVRFSGVESKKNAKYKIIIPGSIIMGAFAIALPLLLKKGYFQAPILQSITSDIYFDVKGKIPPSIWMIFSSVPLLIILSALIKNSFKKPRIFYIIQILVVIVFAFWGLKTGMNSNAEEIMRYDYYARYQKWDKMIKHAEKEPPRNNLSLSMLNLALAKTGQMPVNLFRYTQKPGGLFLDFNNENVAPIMGNEIFYQMGMTNASQYFAFESTESTADQQKSVRAFKRLAETNIINGNYAVANKYLSLLKKTLFYRKWAIDSQVYIDHPELIDKHPEWSEKRKMAVQHDYFIMVRDMEKIMINILNEQPSNKIVFEYLMSYYLINKNLKGFMNNLPRIQYLNYSQMPVLYQEAALFAISLTTDEPEKVNSIPISAETKRRMRSYADVYTSSPNAQEMLKDKFSGTFWYYFHFAK